MFRRKKIQKQERDRLLLGESYDPQTRELRHDDRESYEQRKLILLAAVFGIMVLVVVGWTRTVGSSLSAVSAHGPLKTVDMQWTDLKNEVVSVFEESSALIYGQDEEPVDSSGEVQEAFVELVEKEAAGKNDIYKDWIQYEDPARFYRLFYPHNWFFSVSESGVDVRTSSREIALAPDTPDAVSGSYIVVAYEANVQHTSLQNWVVQKQEEGIYKDFVFELVEFGTVPALHAFSPKNADPSLCFETFVLEHADLFFTVRSCFTDASTNAQYAEVVKNMLASFEFFEPEAPAEQQPLSSDTQQKERSEFGEN